MAEGQGRKMLLGEKAKSMAMVLGQMVAEQLAGCQRRLIIGRTTQSRRGCMRSITVQIWMISYSVSIVSCPTWSKILWN